MGKINWGAIGEQAIGGSVGMGLGLIGNNQQMQNQTSLNTQQMHNQMSLNEQMQDIQQQNWDYTNYENQVKHIENAGLNAGMLYGMGGAGGSTMGGGSGGSAQGGSAPQNAMGMALQGAAVQSQIDLNHANAENARADAAKKLADKTTTDNSRDIFVENLRQQGMAQWWQNLETRYKNENHYDEDPIKVYRNVVYDTSGGIGDDSLNVKKLNAELFKTEAEKMNLDANALLTNTKAQGYWQELMNETAKANAAGIQAAAQKLSAEWNTGELTNWKTWVEVAQKSAAAAGSLIKGGKTVNVTNPTSTTNNY